MKFDDLGLYYIHGRWYNSDVGRFISPDEKGEYHYGSGQNAVTQMWREVVTGATYQIIKNNNETRYSKAH